MLAAKCICLLSSLVTRVHVRAAVGRMGEKGCQLRGRQISSFSVTAEPSAALVASPRASIRPFSLCAVQARSWAGNSEAGGPHGSRGPAVGPSESAPKRPTASQITPVTVDTIQIPLLGSPKGKQNPISSPQSTCTISGR